MSDMHDPYKDQLAAARYRAERDQARQELARLRGEATTMSAYDLLPDEEREAIAWVRDHGGLDAVETRWDNDTQLADAVICALWPYGMPDGGGNEDVMDEISKRLMPEGMEWPRYDTGEPLKLDDEVAVKNCEPVTVRFISFDKNGFSVRHTSACRVHWFTYGERVKRPAPTVLAADNEPLEIGQTVWHMDGRELTVTGLPKLGEYQGVAVKTGNGFITTFDPCLLTHQRPVLDAEGNRIEPAMDVWWVCEGDERGIHAERLHVDGIDGDGMVECSPYNGGTSVVLESSELYVRKPVLDADGVPIREDERVFGINGGLYRVTSAHDGKVFARYVNGPFGSEVESAGGEGLYRLRAEVMAEDERRGRCTW